MNSDKSKNKRNIKHGLHKELTNVPIFKQDSFSDSESKANVVNQSLNPKCSSSLMLSKANSSSSQTRANLPIKTQPKQVHISKLQILILL